MTHDDRAVVTGAFGLRFEPDAVYEPGAADITIVTGGGWATRNDVGAWGEVQRGDWLALLAETHRRGRVLAAVCTGTLLLAHAGVVGHRRAATHHRARTRPCRDRRHRRSTIASSTTATSSPAAA